jgi:hypothetical protein
MASQALSSTAHELHPTAIGEVWSRAPSWWDLAAVLLVLGVVILLGSGAKQMTAPFALANPTPISLSPSVLPMYAVRTTLRMLAADNEADLAELARSLSFEVDDLFPVVDALSIFHFAELKDGQLTLTPDGARFVQLDSDERKAMFAEHLLHFVPLASHIADVLSKREDHRAPRRRFQDELEDHLSHEAADATMTSMIHWGRYAELFTYDSRTRTFANPKALNIEKPDEGPKQNDEANPRSAASS